MRTKIRVAFALFLVFSAVSSASAFIRHRAIGGSDEAPPVGSNSYVLQTDGASHILLADGVSKLLRISNTDYWTPAAIQTDVVRFWDLSDSPNRTLVSGAVSQENSWPGGPTSQVISASQSTAGNRPSASTFYSTFDGTNDLLEESLGPGSLTYGSSVTVPDVSTSTAGKGFVTTGLARAADNTWWVGNHGWPNPSSGASAIPGVIHLSSDLSTILAEITLGSLGFTDANNSVQGVTIDPRDESVWFLKTVAETRLIHLDSAGVFIESFVWSGNALNGLGWDSTQNLLVGLENNNPVIHWIDPTDGSDTGTSVTFPTPVNAYDQIAVDAANNAIVLTSGANGSNGTLVFAELSSGLVRRTITATNSTAIEGVYLDGAGTAYVCNDAYYHNGTGTNFIANYTYVLPSYRPSGDRFLIGYIGRRTSANASSSSIITMGEPVSPTFDGMGLYHPSSTTDSVLFISSNGSAASTATVTGVDIDITNIVILDIDLTAKTATPYINGGAAGTPVSITNAGTLGRNGKWVIGATKPGGTASRWVHAQIGMAFVVRGVSALDQLTGYLAWQTGNQSILDAASPYKNSPPTM